MKGQAPVVFPMSCSRCAGEMGEAAGTPGYVQGHNRLLEGCRFRQHQTCLFRAAPPLNFGASSNPSWAELPLLRCAAASFLPLFRLSPHRAKNSLITGCRSAQKALAYLPSWRRSRNGARGWRGSPRCSGGGCTSQAVTGGGCHTGGAGAGWRWDVLT